MHFLACIFQGFTFHGVLAAGNGVLHCVPGTYIVKIGSPEREHDNIPPSQRPKGLILGLGLFAVLFASAEQALSLYAWKTMEVYGCVGAMVTACVGAMVTAVVGGLAVEVVHNRNLARS